MHYALLFLLFNFRPSQATQAPGPSVVPDSVQQSCEPKLLPQSNSVDDLDVVARAQLNRQREMEAMADVYPTVAEGLLEKVKLTWQAYRDIAREDARGDLEDEYRRFAEQALAPFIEARVIPRALVRTWRRVPLEDVKSAADLRAALSTGWHKLPSIQREAFLQMFMAQLDAFVPAISAKLPPAEAAFFRVSWNEAWMNHAVEVSLGVIALAGRDGGFLAPLAGEFVKDKIFQPFVAPVELDPSGFDRASGVSLTRDLQGIERDLRALGIADFSPKRLSELDVLTPKDPAVFFAYYQQLARNVDGFDFGTILFLNGIVWPEKRTAYAWKNPWQEISPAKVANPKFYRDMPETLRQRLWNRELELRRAARASYEFEDIRDELLRIRLSQPLGYGPYDTLGQIQKNLRYGRILHQQLGSPDSPELDALAHRTRELIRDLHQMTEAQVFPRANAESAVQSLREVHDASAELVQRWMGADR